MEILQAEQIRKGFDGNEVLKGISISVNKGEVLAIIGPSGSGKSTFLRMLSGVLKPDEGTVTIDGAPVYENEKVKLRFFYISDDQHFPGNGTPRDMMAFYRKFYPAFDCGRYQKLLDSFGLPGNRKISTFSKGMKKQLSVLCGICAGTDYLFCDETFDGLDPVMRQSVKSIFAKEMQERQFTPVIASHNLRELEDICDHVGLLHQGGVLLSKDLEEMKCNIQKIQCVFSSKEEEKRLLKQLDIVKCDRRGSLLTLTVRGSREEMIAMFAAADCLFHEVLPLSLEEIFISETEVQGYDIKKIVLG